MIKALTLFFKKLHSKLPVLLFDLGSIPFAWFSAYWLRNNFKPFTHFFFSKQALIALALLYSVQIAAYYYFKIYRGLWRFSSLNDVLRILKAVSSTALFVIPLFYLTSVLAFIPRSILPLYALILTTLWCGARLTMRLLLDKKYQTAGISVQQAKKVLIIGAGQAGESLVRDLNRTNLYQVLGFIDDNIAKIGLEVHGVQVLGPTSQLVKCVKHYAIDLLFIAIPSANSASMRKIVTFCDLTQIPYRTLPSLAALAEGQVNVNTLRAVNIEDLLGRDPVHLEWDKIATAILGKRIVVTGGGGSIGSELCRQIAALKPSCIAIIENSEFNLYQIEQELLQTFPKLSIKPCLISITDELAIEHLFAEFKPEILFHAAAFIHVPMLQNQIRVAVINNIMGTQVLAKASVAFEVEKFILISSDKAVNPTNIMGTTKRVAEIYCQNLNAQVETQFITVRFGNVLGSAGSVVPLFQKQLQQGGPLTVTHPDMMRYFMTIAEASQLILQAMVNGHGGEIFVLDMGEPIKISYLAEQMIRLAGKEPGHDIAIEYVGLRPGEKLYEELFHPSEELVATAHEKLFKAKFRKIEWEELTQTLRMLTAACTAHQEDELLILLNSLVPELHLGSGVFLV